MPLAYATPQIALVPRMSHCGTRNDARYPGVVSGQKATQQMREFLIWVSCYIVWSTLVLNMFSYVWCHTNMISSLKFPWVLNFPCVFVQLFRGFPRHFFPPLGIPDVSPSQWATSLAASTHLAPNTPHPTSKVSWLFVPKEIYPESHHKLEILSLNISIIYTDTSMNLFTICQYIKEIYLYPRTIY